MKRQNPRRKTAIHEVDLIIEDITRIEEVGRGIEIITRIEDIIATNSPYLL